MVTNPATTGASFDWTDGPIGRDKIKNFTEADIAAAEAGARENFRKKYGTDATAAAIYSYRVRLIRSPFPDGFDINSTPTGFYFYMNYFKPSLNAATIIKNTNDGISDWNMTTGFAEYKKGGQQSNMYDARTSETTKVNAFHLFPNRWRQTLLCNKSKTECLI